MADRGQSEHPRNADQDHQTNTSSAPESRGNEGRDNGGASTLESPQGRERKGTANRGFAAMDREKQKRIASEGGRAAHRQGVAHEWNKDEAKQAGKKGGEMVSRNRDHMSEIGRKGGQSSGKRRGQQGGDATK